MFHKSIFSENKNCHNSFILKILSHFSRLISVFGAKRRLRALVSDGGGGRRSLHLSRQHHRTEGLSQGRHEHVHATLMIRCVTFIRPINTNCPRLFTQTPLPRGAIVHCLVKLDFVSIFCFTQKLFCATGTDAVITRENNLKDTGASRLSPTTHPFPHAKPKPHGVCQQPLPHRPHYPHGTEH
jgi:hypothetical protein